MYINHFGLAKLPFENVPDPAFFFDHGDHARVRHRVEESLKAGRGLTLVTGHIGSGKTTISQMIKSDLANGLKFIWMAEPPANSLDLFLFLAQELGLTPSSSEKTFIMRDIREALLKINADGNKCLVIIDEAHLMSDDTINGIRLLNNLEEGSSKLIQLLLLGQEELMKTINRPEMEPFKQRIATLEILGKMNPDRIREYVSHRIHVAGGQPAIFTDTGWKALDKAFDSGSTPRVINSLCDKSLTTAFERQKKEVDVDDVYEAAKSMGMQKEIFFYKLELTQQSGEIQSPPAGEQDAIKRSEEPSPGPAPASDTQLESPAGVHTTRQAESFQSQQMELEPRKGLKVPILFFVLSIIALILSVVFYCQGAGTADVLTCLQELINSF